MAEGFCKIFVQGILSRGIDIKETRIKCFPYEHHRYIKFRKEGQAEGMMPGIGTERLRENMMPKIKDP